MLREDAFKTKNIVDLDTLLLIRIKGNKTKEISTAKYQCASYTNALIVYLLSHHHHILYN